jgi:hypothetical protein
MKIKLVTESFGGTAELQSGSGSDRRNLRLDHRQRIAPVDKLSIDGGLLSSNSIREQSADLNDIAGLQWNIFAAQQLARVHLESTPLSDDVDLRRGVRADVACFEQAFCERQPGHPGDNWILNRAIENNGRTSMLPHILHCLSLTSLIGGASLSLCLRFRDASGAG